MFRITPVRFVQILTFPLKNSMTQASADKQQIPI